MTSRRTVALVAAVVAVLCAFTFASDASAASGGGCQLKGTASFTPGLSTTSQPFTYSFVGDLTGCKSTDAGAPATGVVQAGGTYTDPASGKAYVLPNATGSGGRGARRHRGRQHDASAGQPGLSAADGHDNALPGRDVTRLACNRGDDH